MFVSQKLQDYALVAEIVGAIAVVVSLVYVGVGIRQNTEVVQVANHQALVAMDMEKNASLRDQEFAAIYVLAREDYEQLSKFQRSQYESFIADTLNMWEFAYITYSNDAMDETIWTGWDGFYRTELSAEPFQKFWDGGRENFSPKFRTYVDSILSSYQVGS